MRTINITINIPLLLLFKVSLWKNQIPGKTFSKSNHLEVSSQDRTKNFLVFARKCLQFSDLKLNFLLRRAMINFMDV